MVAKKLILCATCRPRLFDGSLEDKVDTLVQGLTGQHENRGQVAGGKNDSDVAAGDGQW